MRKAIFAVALWALAAVPLPVLAQSTLRMVAHADLKILDPIWSTANITRNHGYMVYDVLFSTDAAFRIQPQMAEKYEVSSDRLTWTFTLRDGLEWHDGKPVTAEDCVASIRRWGARDGFGQLLLQATAELKPVDAKTFVLVLKEPFGLVLEALGKIGSNVPFMMPER
ncbi:MAG TPA: ABC transporter substrate-binding protein, partial [Reyranella sp.]|nr:ABC transporter substrate-binding protein [Reyranella sp.]